MHGVAVRAIHGLERQQLRLRQLVAGIDARIDTGGRATRPLQGLLHVGWLFFPQSSALCAGSAGIGGGALFEPACQDLGRLGEIGEREVGEICLDAMVEQEAFGQHQVGAARDAEVGAAIADHDRQLARRSGDEVALAVAGQRPAVAARVRECEAPAVVAAPLQVIGVIGQVEAVAPQDRVDRAVEPVRHDVDAMA